MSRTTGTGIWIGVAGLVIVLLSRLFGSGSSVTNYHHVGGAVGAIGVVIVIVGIVWALVGVVKGYNDTGAPGPREDEEIRS
jgi:hypothetical protein